MPYFCSIVCKTSVWSIVRNRRFAFLQSFVLFGKFPSYTSGMNNSFNDSIAQICGLELSALVGSYKYSVFGGTTVVVEGHKGITNYSDNEISFRLSDGVLTIAGSDLKIKCLSKNFAVITGRINNVGVMSK